MLQQDDLDTAEALFLSQHLAECDACRARVIDYQWVGDALRQLPQEAPPASFSAAVHARIAAIAQGEADQRAKRGATGVAIAALSRAETLPELPVVGSVSGSARGASLAGRPRTPSAPIVRLPVARMRQSGFGPLARAALGMAAVFLVAVFLVQFMRGVGSFGSIASGLFNGVSHDGGSTNVTTYLPNARFGVVTNALATTGWVVYSAVDTTGAAMLIGENRLTKQSVPLLSAALKQPITLYALTSRWVIWASGRVGSAGAATVGKHWALYATLLPTAVDLSTLSDAAIANLTYTLADNNPTSNVADVLDGVWADDTMALVAEETQAGQSALERFALTATAAATATHRLSGVSAYRAAPGHRVMNPSAADGVIYWADVWAGADHMAHSAIWREGADGHARQALPNDADDAFAPAAAHGALVWVSAQAPLLGDRSLAAFAFSSSLASDPFDALDAVAATATVGVSGQSLATVTGVVQVYNVGDQQRWVIGEDATAQSLQADGDLLLWRSGSRRHTYDLRAKAPTSVDSQVASAPVAGLTDSSIAWSTGPASPIYVYDVAA